MLFNAIAPVTTVCCFLLLINHDALSADCLHLDNVDTMVVAVWEVDVAEWGSGVAVELVRRGKGGEIGNEDGYADNGGGPA